MRLHRVGHEIRELTAEDEQLITKYDIPDQAKLEHQMLQGVADLSAASRSTRHGGGGQGVRAAGSQGSTGGSQTGPDCRPCQWSFMVRCA